MLLVDVSFTSHCAAPTGVQRVSRELCLELERREEALSVCFDRWQGRWRLLNENERMRLDGSSSARFTRRRQRWSAGESISGAISRVFPRIASKTRLPRGPFDGLVVPEKLESRRPEEICRIRSQLKGASVAVFHDLIPVKFPMFATRRSAAEFPSYLETLLYHDGVAAVSESSKQDLLAYWEERGVKTHPPVEAISPGAGLPLNGDKQNRSVGAETPIVLMVATIEARKNHIAVLEACQRLWEQGLEFKLNFAGRLSRDTGKDVLGRINRLREANWPVHWLGHITDAELRQQFSDCRFTLHPSLYEGFGLPILESLSYGKPCVVSDRGALAETAAGGGCYLVSDPTADEIADAIQELLRNQELYERLVAECSEREFKAWDQYCDELTSWQRSLKKRTVD